MPVTFDAKPMEFFGSADFKNDNAIVQLGGDRQLKSDSTFSSANIFRWMRGPETRQQNNEIRTQLLKSLGESFGLSGMGTGANGEITFSKDFMDKLEKLIGPAFKRDDFGVPAEGGAVSSGKPLTARRLNAIRASAGVYDVSDFSLDAYKQKVGAILREQFGIDTTLGLSKEKFQALTKNDPALEVYAGIEKSIDFLQNGFKDFVREEPSYSLDKEFGESDEKLAQHAVKFEVKDPETGEYKDMRTHSCSDSLFKILRGNLIHTERADFSYAASRDIAPLKKYVGDTLKGFIKNGVDAYLEAKMNGKLGELMQHLEKPGACTEDKVMKFYEFRQKHFQAKVDTGLETELNRIINNTAFTPFDKVLETEIEAITEQHPEFKTWKEYGPELKRRLVNLRRPMVTVTEANGKTLFVPEKDTKGSPVIRAIRAEDIDTIGKKMYEAIYGEDD